MIEYERAQSSDYHTTQTLLYRVGELEKDLQTLSRKVDRLLWALVTLTLTIAGSSVVFAITVLSVRGTSR